VKGKERGCSRLGEIDRMPHQKGIQDAPTTAQLAIHVHFCFTPNTISYLHVVPVVIQN
jgi:hypothetical protein